MSDGTADYTYDDVGQLTGADYDYQTDETYTYDDTGNRTNTGHTTGANNRTTSDGVYNYTYDAEGNMTSRTSISSGAVTEYTWDYRNRLTSVTQKASAGSAAQWIVEYTYDYQNRLVKRSYDSDAAGSAAAEVTTWIYDGIQMVLQFDGTGDLTSTDLSHRYMYGAAVDQILADEAVGCDTYWTLTDHQNTVRDLATAVGIVTHRSYNAFGILTDETANAVDCLFGYTGKMFDEVTELQNNVNRWYDPELGKWLSEDPIGFNGMDVNLYCYVGNDVTNKSDPTGRFPLLLLLGLGAGILFPVFSGCSPQNPGAPFADVELVQDNGIATIFIRSDCTIVLLFGHGHETKPHKFDFGNSEHVKGGFVGCYPGTTNKLIPNSNRLPECPMDDKFIQTESEASKQRDTLLEKARDEARKLVASGHCLNGVTIKTLWVGYEGIDILKKPFDETEVIYQYIAKSISLRV